jgi:hypothetical protein
VHPVALLQPRDRIPHQGIDCGLRLGRGAFTTEEEEQRQRRSDGPPQATAGSPTRRGGQPSSGALVPHVMQNRQLASTASPQDWHGTRVTSVPQNGQ